MHMLYGDVIIETKEEHYCDITVEQWIKFQKRQFKPLATTNIIMEELISDL